MLQGSNFLFFEDKVSNTSPRPDKLALSNTLVHDHWRDQLGVSFAVLLGYSLVYLAGSVMNAETCSIFAGLFQLQLEQAEDVTKGWELGWEEVSGRSQEFGDSGDGLARFWDWSHGSVSGTEEERRKVVSKGTPA